MIEITLTPHEQKIVEYIGKQRYLSNRQANITDDKRGNQSNEDTDVNGFGAEYAFAKLANVMPDFTVSPRRGGIDCVLPNGITVDVKQTKLSNGKLISKKDSGSDIYVLMVGTLPVYKFIGWALSKHLINQKVNLGHGLTYCLSQDSCFIIKDMPPLTKPLESVKMDA